MINQAVHVLSKELGWFFYIKCYLQNHTERPCINISSIYIHLNFCTIYPDNNFKITPLLFWVHPTGLTECLYENVSSHLVEFFCFSKRKRCKYEYLLRWITHFTFILEVKIYVTIVESILLMSLINVPLLPNFSFSLTGCRSTYLVAKDEVSGVDQRCDTSKYLHSSGH